MASRRAQIRQVFQSVPAEQLSGTSLDALYARCESNLAAVDVWANQGNQRALRQAGTGVVAICAWLAAKSLADNPRQTAFQDQSGLSPAQFSASERELLPAVRKIITTGRSQTSTPQKRQHDPADDDNGIHAHRTPTSSLSRSNADGGHSAASPADAVAQWVHNIKSGISPTKRPSASPLTPSHRRAARAEASSALSGQSSTPSRSGLRDRSTIKSKTTFDPSPAEASSPSKTKRSALASASGSLSGSPSKRTNAHLPAATSSSAPLSTPLGRTPSSRKHKLGAGTSRGNVSESYPVPLGFRLDEPVRGKKWSVEEARERVQRVLDALKEGARADAWQTKTPGVLEAVELT